MDLVGRIAPTLLVLGLRALGEVGLCHQCSAWSHRHGFLLVYRTADASLEGRNVLQRPVSIEVVDL